MPMAPALKIVFVGSPGSMGIIIKIVENLDYFHLRNMARQDSLKPEWRINYKSILPFQKDLRALKKSYPIIRGSFSRNYPTMLLSSDSCKKVQVLVINGKYQSSVICGLTALG